MLCSRKIFMGEKFDENVNVVGKERRTFPDVSLCFRSLR